MRDPPRGHSDRDSHEASITKASFKDYRAVFKVPSYLLDTLGMSAMFFGIYGISFFMPAYLQDHHAARDPNRATLIYGCLQLVAGVTASLIGGVVGDLLQRRFGGAYFVVSAVSIFLSAAFILLMLFSPFPQAWVWLFLAAFFIFFAIGPANTILANVIHPSMRATAFALNIFLIYALGATLAPPLMGELVDRYPSWRPAFYLVCATLAVGGVLWLCGARYLERDTQRAMRREG
jgi:MFS family permease